jgi:hypothetical protein
VINFHNIISCSFRYLFKVFTNVSGGEQTETQDRTSRDRRRHSSSLVSLQDVVARNIYKCRITAACIGMMVFHLL